MRFGTAPPLVILTLFMGKTLRLYRIRIPIRRTLVQQLFRGVAGFAGALICAVFVATTPSAAQDSLSTISPAGGPEMFFDARRSSFTRDGGKQLFEGDVIAIGAGSVISADSVLIDRAAGVIEGKGHVIIVADTQVFTGTNITYQIGTGDFRLENALMVARDPAEVRKVTDRVLGFTPTEVEFEVARAARLREISARKSELRHSARAATAAGRDLDARLIDSYARLIEQDELIRLQDNPSLARLAPQKRDTYRKRREYWDKGRQLRSPVAGAVPETWYFRMTGREIERTNGNDFRATESVFTPCRCAEDERPDWAFRASSIKAQIGGYADLHNPVFEIKGVPVLYMPWLKVPIKDRRQSGFLLPVLGFDSRSGNIVSQPVFFDLSPAADITLTTDLFERRGTRVGMEWRYQERQNSGWTLGVEAMRDGLWMRERADRERWEDLYAGGLRAARNTGGATPTEAQAPMDGEEAARRQLANRGFWEANAADCLNDDPLVRARCDRFLASQLAPPVNTWRGVVSWRGQTYVAPRLSIVTHGDVVSDHRYGEELNVVDDFEEALAGGRRMPAFNRVRAQAHLGAEEFYLGVGTALGDSVRLQERFEGLQIPARAVVQSRVFRISPSDWRFLQVYGQASVEEMRIAEISRSSAFVPEDQGVREALESEDGRRLGEGSWRRGAFKLTAPLTSGGAIKVDHFTDLETRQIEAAGIPGRTNISALRTGVRFQLPIDGRAEISERFVPKGVRGGQADGDVGHRRPNWFVHHLMNWGLTFATRPTVVRRGDYGGEINGSPSPDDPTGGQTWFLADSSRLDQLDEDGDVPWDKRLVPSQTIGFDTTHRWRLVSRSWAIEEAAPRPQTDSADAPRESARELARRELLHSLDRPVEGTDQMFDPAGTKWYVNRYRLTDATVAEPLQFGAGINYDFLRAKRRREEIEKSVASRPWSEPYARLGVAWAGWTLGTQATWNVYEKTAKSTVASLAVPEFWKTSLQFGYVIERQVLIDADQDASFRLTRTRSVAISTGLLPDISTTVVLAKRTKDEEIPPEKYETRVGLSYADRSGCWGLRFLRTKEFDKDEALASYLLQLQVIFLGETRELPNMSAPVTREITAREDPGQR